MDSFVRIARSVGVCAALAGAGLAAAVPAHAADPSPGMPAGGLVSSDQSGLSLGVIGDESKEIHAMRPVGGGGGCNTEMRSHVTKAAVLGPLVWNDSSSKQCS